MRGAVKVPKWAVMLFAAALIAAASAWLAGCSGQLNDLGGIGQASPDYALTYLNVSDFPNITLVCIRGVGFATTTRTYDPLTRVPEWDGFCATKTVVTPRPAPSSTATGQ